MKEKTRVFLGIYPRTILFRGPNALILINHKDLIIVHLLLIIPVFIQIIPISKVHLININHGRILPYEIQYIGISNTPQDIKFFAIIMSSRFKKCIEGSGIKLYEKEEMPRERF